MKILVAFIWLKKSQQADQNGYPARPLPTNAPEAYPQGYVEDAFKVRTKLGTVFSSLLGFGAAETGVTIARLRQELETPIGEKIFRRVGPGATAEHFKLT